jgi:hypothetical protein
VAWNESGAAVEAGEHVEQLTPGDHVGIDRHGVGPVEQKVASEHYVALRDPDDKVSHRMTRVKFDERSQAPEVDPLGQLRRRKRRGGKGQRLIVSQDRDSLLAVPAMQGRLSRIPVISRWIPISTTVGILPSVRMYSSSSHPLT